MATKGREKKMRRRLRTCQTMRKDSAHEAGSSSVSATASDMPMALRSQRPRTGSRSLRPMITKTSVTRPNTKNGDRQPQ